MRFSTGTKIICTTLRTALRFFSSHGLTNALLIIGLPALSWAADDAPIGKITMLEHRDDNPVMLDLGSKKRAACRECPVFEGDVIRCNKSQKISIELNDGSILTVGASSTISLDSWTKRTSEGYLRRVIGFSHGVLRAVINKVYSEKEPFVVKTKTAAMGVRGTEFIVTVNEDRLIDRDPSHTTHLYTVKGEVHFAASENDFISGHFVRALAGYHSVMSYGMNVPTTPKQFNRMEFQQLIQDRLPKTSKVEIQKEGKYEIQEVRTNAVVGEPNSKKPNHDLIKPTVIGDKLDKAKTEAEKKAVIERTEMRGIKEKTGALENISADVEKNKLHDKAPERNQLLEKERQFQSPLKDNLPSWQNNNMLNRIYQIQPKNPGVLPGSGAVPGTPPQVPINKQNILDRLNKK